MTYQSFIKSLEVEQPPNWEKAMELVRNMRTDPDASIYSRVLGVCIAAGRTGEAMELLEEMKSRQLSPSENDYCALVAACDSAGESATVLLLAEKAVVAGHALNDSAARAVLQACADAAAPVAKEGAEKTEEKTGGTGESGGLLALPPAQRVASLLELSVGKQEHVELYNAVIATQPDQALAVLATMKAGHLSSFLFCLLCCLFF